MLRLLCRAQLLCKVVLQDCALTIIDPSTQSFGGLPCIWRNGELRSCKLAAFSHSFSRASLGFMRWAAPMVPPPGALPTPSSAFLFALFGPQTIAKSCFFSSPLFSKRCSLPPQPMFATLSVSRNANGQPAAMGRYRYRLGRRILPSWRELDWYGGSLAGSNTRRLGINKPVKFSILKPRIVDAIIRLVSPWLPLRLPLSQIYHYY
jgi:hypothetical protein